MTRSMTSPYADVEHDEPVHWLPARRRALIINDDGDAGGACGVAATPPH
eukprot:gene3177-9666_t